MNYKLFSLTVVLLIVGSYFLYQGTQKNTAHNSDIESKFTEAEQITKQTKSPINSLKEPSLAELTASSNSQEKAIAPHLPVELQVQREKLKDKLLALLYCDKTNTCPVDNSDSRASDLLKGQQLTLLLDEYRELHQQQDYYDAETAAMVKEFINDPDGYVQEAAINLMSVMPPNEENAQALINSLKTSYDAKIMAQAMNELKRYPQLNNEIDELLQQSLQTGSFYVGQEIALNILPYLNENNLQQYIDVANSLPQNGKKARALWSNINEFKKRLAGG